MCGLAFLGMRLFLNASLKGFCTLAGETWCRPIAPVRGFLLRLFEGKTYCQTHSNSAFGYFLARANGISTRPSSRLKSFSCIFRANSNCFCSGSISFVGITVKRSLPPLPSLTTICRNPKSKSFYAKPQSLDQPQTRSMQQICNQPIRAAQIFKNCFYFFLRQHNRNAARFFRGLKFIQPRQIYL